MDENGRLVAFLGNGLDVFFEVVSSSVELSDCSESL